MKTTYIKDCIICHKTFSYQKYSSIEITSPRMTCSEKCRLKLVSIKLSGRFIPNKQNEKDLSKWITTECKNCRKSLYHQQSVRKIFCSKECKIKWMKENLKRENNPNWKPNLKNKPFRSVKKQVRRELILERKKCETCGNTEKLQVHHKDKNRGNNHPDNLMLLCKSCHANIHERQGELRTARFIKSHPQTR